MFLEKKVRDLMIPIKDYAVTSPDNTLQEAIFEMRRIYCEVETGKCTEAGHRTGLVMQDGKLKGIIGDEVVVLEEGDSIYIDSSIPHRWENIGKTEMRAIWAITPPSF